MWDDLTLTYQQTTPSLYRCWLWCDWWRFSWHIPWSFLLILWDGKADFDLDIDSECHYWSFFWVLCMTNDMLVCFWIAWYKTESPDFLFEIGFVHLLPQRRGRVNTCLIDPEAWWNHTSRSLDMNIWSMHRRSDLFWLTWLWAALTCWSFLKEHRELDMMAWSLPSSLHWSSWHQEALKGDILKGKIRKRDFALKFALDTWISHWISHSTRHSHCSCSGNSAGKAPSRQGKPA